MFKLLRGRSQKLIQCAFNQYCCSFSENAKPKDKLPETSPEKPAIRLKSLNQKKRTEVTKEDLVWRTPWHQKNVEYYSTLRTFYTEDNQISLLKWIQQPIDLSPASIKNWYNRLKEQREKILQRYIPDRHSILGPELACAHFIVYRGGAVKFHNDDKWIKAVNGEYSLPNRYRTDMYLQAIDCSNTSLRYEGLDNLRGLQNVEWLSLNGCEHIDDYCMDVITNIFSHSLVYLDIRNIFSISERGLGALYKINHLKMLYLDDMLKDTRYELTCLLLEELNSALEIKSDVVKFEIE
ncbi:hypothetical protein HUJ04_003572 [Dendroctonus ponderosae]|uniref:Mitochondrial ATP synthase regulatory component factor B n=1 Tax=Dendroctonus ponderosae TaxID=77166 RepID=A0AAR5PIW3_DENPD|nr:hypothetical protein HUJ04_003572 [Dendroctonus ponderosae]